MFRQFVHDLDPRFSFPSRRHVSANLILALHDEKKSAVHDVISAARSVSLTVDIWTDHIMHAYLAVTAHLSTSSRSHACSC